MLVDESVRPAPRRYRPGDGFAGASPNESERSGMLVFSVIDGAMSPIGFLRSLSSLVPIGGPADERLDDPEVDTVESDEEEGCDGWPSRVWLTWLGSCCRTWGAGVETDRVSWRSWGVVLKAYGAIGAAVPLYPVPPEFPLCWLRGICDARCGWCGWFGVPLYASDGE
jgi:hypothetical protein